MTFIGLANGLLGGLKCKDIQGRLFGASRIEAPAAVHRIDAVFSMSAGYTGFDGGATPDEFRRCRISDDGRLLSLLC